RFQELRANAAEYIQIHPIIRHERSYDDRNMMRISALFCANLLSTRLPFFRVAGGISLREGGNTNAVN
ncbi:MAG TPA: hypothetical protein VNW73_12215, partial [Ktedonobacteraceae bacterium]|nr:hypothetical protein [Ktedonobacteraceae bacterium]